MKNALTLTQKHYESSCGHTPEYLHWHKTFKKAFSTLLTSLGATNIAIGKPNHFDMSGFFTVGNQSWWFRIEDLRWAKAKMLIRTASSYTDYVGGFNQYVRLDNVDNFTTDIKKVLTVKNILL